MEDCLAGQPYLLDAFEMAHLCGIWTLWYFKRFLDVKVEGSLEEFLFNIRFGTEVGC